MNYLKIKEVKFIVSMIAFIQPVAIECYQKSFGIFVKLSQISFIPCEYTSAEGDQFGEHLC